MDHHLTCQLCKVKKGTKRCGRCKTAIYCSKECQMKDWIKDHRSICDQVLQRQKMKIDLEELKKEYKCISECMNCGYSGHCEIKTTMKSDVVKEKKKGGEVLSVDKASIKMIDVAKKSGIETIWDRYARVMGKQCNFGQKGICCKNCNMGPCRITKENPNGICGASKDTIVARNLIRTIAGGSAAHSDHGREVLLTLKKSTVEHKHEKEDKDHDHHHGVTIKNEEKLLAIAKELGVNIRLSKQDIIKKVAEKLKDDYANDVEELNGAGLNFMNRVPDKRMKKWKEFKIVPRAIDREVVEILHRTTMGVDHDPVSLLLSGLRCSLADGFGGSMIATECTDILYGGPKIREISGNLGVLKENSVNIIIHGHEPLLSFSIVEAAKDPEIIKLVKDVGAEKVNIVGMCCTGHEILVRSGIPLAGNFMQQELALTTGAVEAMVVDVQCIMPSLPGIASCFHTKFISTNRKANFPGALKMEFSHDNAKKISKDILVLAIENFKKRVKEKVNIPSETEKGVGCFSVENVLAALGGSLTPLLEAIKKNSITGIVGVVGCNNPKVPQDSSHLALVKELNKRNLLVVSTGCNAIACLKGGLLKLEPNHEVGKGLKAVCKGLGIPPVLHMGSCVDNSRILTFLCAVANALKVDISDLPVAGAAPEWMSEKAVAIACYFVSSGVTTLLGVVPNVLGSELVTDILVNKIEGLMGAKFVVETDPIKGADIIEKHVLKKRTSLGLPV